MSDSNTGLIVPANSNKSSIDGNCLKEDSIVFGESQTSDIRILPEPNRKTNRESFHIWNSKSYYHARNWKLQTHREICALISLVILFTICLLFLGLWLSEKFGNKGRPCLEPTCIKVSSEILSNLDPNVSPCENFYEYACNGWIKQNHIPQGHNTWSIMRKLSKSGEYFTKELLENTSQTDPGRGYKLAQIYYRSCMNETQIEQRGYEPLFHYLTQLFDGWALLPPNKPGSRQVKNDSFLTVQHFDLTQLYMPPFKYSGALPLCRISVGQDQMNSSRFVIDLSEGSLSLQREYYVNDTFPTYSKRTDAFRRFMRNYSLLLGVPMSSMHEVDQIYSFEREIALRTEERSEKDPEKNYELVTLSNLSTICPVLDWNRLLQSLYNSLNHTLSQNQPIALHDRNFFRQRCTLYTEFLKTDTGIRTLHNVAVWNFMWKTVNRMPKHVSELLQEYREVESGLKIDPDRWQTCVTEVQSPFGSVIGRFFVKERFNKQSKDAATEMITEIKDAFKENFADVKWMQEADKVKAIEKVNSMKASVGYPHNINDILEENKLFASILEMNESTYFENGLRCAEVMFKDLLSELITQDADKWVLPVHIVNAFYKENSNHIYFPAGILQSPLYHHEHPLSLNFGGIGMVVGHEITHAFDQHGAKFDAKGNMREWWSAETLSAFEKNSQCMIEQYNSYSILNTSLNGKMTLGENIADNGGIKAAYKAFKKLQAKYTDKPVLPGLNFTPDQLFFIGFAQLWCVKNFPQSVLNAVLFDVHSVDQYRVIGTLTNFQEFAHVFNCPVGSPMNPKKKCRVW